MTIKTRIIRIGNSQGLRVPKILLDEAHLSEEVELSARPGQLSVRSLHRPRQGWKQAAKAMRQSGEDRLLDAAVPTRFEVEEWEW